MKTGSIFEAQPIHTFLPQPGMAVEDRSNDIVLLASEDWILLQSALSAYLAGEQLPAELNARLRALEIQAVDKI